MPDSARLYPSAGAAVAAAPKADPELEFLEARRRELARQASADAESAPRLRRSPEPEDFDDDTPSPPPFPDIYGLMASVPEWVTCSACGRDTNRSPCFECSQERIARDDEEREREARAERAGVPLRFARHAIGSQLLDRCVIRPRLIGELPQTADAIATLLAKSRRALVIGRSQRGKTSLAAAALNSRKSEALFVNAADLADAHRGHRMGQGFAPLVERARTVPILLIDDLGDEGPEVDAIKRVIKFRFDREATTWVSMGLSLEMAESRYGSGVVNRLRSGIVILVGEDDVRGPK